MSKKSTEQSPGPEAKGRSQRDLNGYSKHEVMSIICNLLTQGVCPSEMRQVLEAKYGIRVSREAPYAYIQEAAKRGWLRFVPPCSQVVRRKLQKQYHLGGVSVVESPLPRDVACRGAMMLLKLVQNFRRKHPDAVTCHIGMAGGSTLRELSRAFAQLLRLRKHDLPPRIDFHAMVAGFNVADPATDPNSFITYFVSEPLVVDIGFVGLHAPGLVKLEQFEELKKFDMVADAFARREQLDIIVMSAGHQHSSLQSFLDESVRLEPAAPGQLESGQLEAGGSAAAGGGGPPVSRCIGDVMWRPISADGPMADELPLRAVTLMELADLAEFVRQGGDSLLVLGPCGVCRQPKTEILQAVLQLRNRLDLITHLVCDIRAANGVLREEPVPPGKRSPR